MKIYLLQMQTQSINWRNLRSVCMLFALLMLSGAMSWVAPHLQPQLAQLAAAQPNSTVNVIVQKTTRDTSLESKVAQLGGLVTTDLHIINAFAAELPAQAVLTLAQADGVRWISLDAPLTTSGGPDNAVNTDNLLNSYAQTVKVDQLWSEGYQGSGVTVAVVDSGVNTMHPDLSRVSRRVLAQPSFASGPSTSNADLYGHGTHVAGIIGGDGTAVSGKYIGIAPKVNLVSVKVSDDQGMATASTVVAGLQWVNDNRATYNIKVVNLSLNSSTSQSYNVDPLDAAVEILWFNQIVVVVSAGNVGKNELFPPANDPFVITVGATDDNSTPLTSDDTLAKYSSSGTTSDGFKKPDLVAPGTNIVSLNSGAPASNSVLAKAHPANLVANNFYFRMSGTSMAAPVVSGAVALLLQSNPNLTPDQIKYRLLSTANNASPFNTSKAGLGLLDAYKAVHASSTASANTGFAASQLLWTGHTPITWTSVNWNSVNWNSVNWNSVNWNSVNWNSVNWNSDYWGN